MTRQIRSLSLLLYTVYWFTLSVIEVPSVALLERAICIQKYQDATVDEASCKKPDIQTSLSHTLGWKAAFNSSAGLVTAVYYGSIAERYGKKPVLFLSACGYAAMTVLDVIICSFPFTIPFRTIWGTSALLLIGGGHRVYSSMVYALVSDSFSSDQRTTQLYLLGLGSNVVKFIDPRIAAALMQTSLLAPFYLAFVTFGVVLILITQLVETEHKGRGEDYRIVPSGDGTDESPVIPNPTIQTTSSPGTAHHLTEDQNIVGSGLRFGKLGERMKKFGAPFDTPAAFYCLAAMFLKRIGFASNVFATQYVSEKFKWDYHQTTWLRVSGSGAAILVYLIAPLVNAWLLTRGSLPHVVDLNTIRGSLLVLAVSFFGAWMANSGAAMVVAIFCIGLGETLQPALQGFVTFATGSRRNTRVFTVLALVDTAADLIAGPLTAALLSFGRTEGHPSEGLCFFVSSAIFTLLLLWTFLFNMPSEDPES